MESITFEDIKNIYGFKLNKEEEVNCRFLLKLKEGYLVDINGLWEGFITNSHMLEDLIIDLEQNKEIKALVLSGPDKGDRYLVSPRLLRERSIYDKLQKAKDSVEILTVKISKPVKGGAEVYIEGLRAFLPGRYIRLPGLSPEEWLNKEINVIVEELDLNEKKIILNQKKAMDFERDKIAIETINKLKEGDIVEAKILRVADFGVFVDLGGIDGLVPASELSWGRFSHPGEVAKVGDLVRARVFRVERDNKRIALSVKQLQGDPWEEINWEIGTELEGKVIGNANFGIFIELVPGVEALLHNREIPEKFEKPKVSEKIKVRILKIDMDERRIGLALCIQKPQHTDNNHSNGVHSSNENSNSSVSEEESKEDLSPVVSVVTMEKDTSLNFSAEEVKS